MSALKYDQRGLRLVSGGKVIVALDPIRIYHECEGRIEKSIPRITVWHQEA